MIKEQLEFGSGSFVGPVMRDPVFWDTKVTTVRDQARILGWVDSCPVVEDLTDPENTEPGRGPEAMLERYGEVNYWYSYIVDTVAAHNNDLCLQLTSSVPRKAGESVGKFEPQSVPLNHEYVISPMGTLPGFALPRLLIKQFGPTLETTDRYDKARVQKGLVVVDVAAKDADTPAELLALTAEGLSFADLDPLTVLSGTLPTGWMEEHNATSMLNTVKDALYHKAPALWAEYQRLTPEEKAAHHIA